MHSSVKFAIEINIEQEDKKERVGEGRKLNCAVLAANVEVF